MVSSSLSWHPNLHLPPTRRWPEIFIWEKHLLYGIPKKNNTHLDLVVADSPGRAVSPSPASAEFAVVAAPIHKRSSQQQFWLATLLSALKGPTSTNYQPWEILRVYFGILDVHKSMVPFECCSNKAFDAPHSIPLTPLCLKRVKSCWPQEGSKVHRFVACQYRESLSIFIILRSTWSSFKVLLQAKLESCSTEITEFISSTSFHQKCPETLGGSALRLLWFEGWAASAKPVNMSFNIENGGAGVQVMH
jgi:hypothetical protein